MNPSRLLRQAACLGLLAAAALASASVTQPTIGKLIWSEEFNAATLDPALWTASDGNGCQINLCGYGNRELQYYHPNNLALVNVPFEPATRALAITARRELIGSNQFSSGKVDSGGKVQVKYGLIEVRMATPKVGVGLWPAAWMLGVSPQTWPRNGEIDIMEMGGRQPAGLPPISPDQFVSANAISYQPAACVPGNESCAGSSAWQNKSWYTPSRSLANRFVRYRLYWTDTQMRFTVVDNGREYDLYKAPIAINSPALQEPFYLLLNMAVGGNFTPAATPEQVTAALPATTYVDYIRVYELDGLGEVKLGAGVPPEVGRFGVFTDLSTVNNKLEAGRSSDIFVWNGASLGAGDLAPFEGANVLAFRYFAPGQWFGGSIQSRQKRDMSGFRGGHIRLKIKAPANLAFRIGIYDTYTNQGSVTFPAHATAYGLVRNGEWGEASIPVAEIAGPRVALQSMLDLFQFYSVDGALPGETFQIAFDDIVWDSGSGTRLSVAAPSGASAALGSASQVGPGLLSFTLRRPGGTDLHYSVNGGPERQLRMQGDGRTSRYTANGLQRGDWVSYRFSVWDAASRQRLDSAPQRVQLR